VADRDNSRIQKFNSSGGLLAKWGTPGTGDGQLSGPLDVAVDLAGNVTVADTSNRRLQVFSSGGAFISKLTTLAPAITTFSPESVAFEPGGDFYVLDAEAGASRVLRVRDSQAPPPPGGVAAPVLGEAVNVEVVSGRVLVAVPAVAARAAGGRASQKGLTFVPLEETRQIPVGSFLDTKRGTVELVSATGSGSKTQSGRFSSGVFQVLQSRARRQRGLTELRLKGASFNRCRARGGASAARLSRRTIRRLRANAKGRFRTRGRHSAATVRGTVWITADRCDGTLTTVKRGKVAVRDLRRKRTITLTAGKSYLARAPR